ncbi:MAG TPA: aminotransferase class V-fold PLP-dependent enzyme, partial [Polyangiaceae bacterium]|nr:aminotransferase class V-fold PLP-dependent enzyme [Polyangiaceae bacterium]
MKRSVEQALERYAQSGAGAFGEYLAQRANLRTKLETLIHAEKGSVALAANTSRGVSDIALSIPWRAGDRALVFTGEFPANIAPWQQAAELFELKLVWQDSRRFLERPSAALEDVERELKQGIRLVAVSAVQFQTGLCMPLQQLGDLCQRYGAELCVDAIQACGVVPVDVAQSHIHYLACGGHKWLMGMEGSGFVYVEPQCASKLHPRVAGWMSCEEPEDFLFGPGLLRYDKPLRKSALAFETGTLSVLGFAALEAGLDLILSLGVPKILEHVTAYLDALEPQLVVRGFQSLRGKDESARSGILSLVPPAGHDAASLRAKL